MFVLKCSLSDATTVLPNAFCQDHTLSLATRSVLLDLFSRPNDWVISIAGVCKTCRVGRDSALRAFAQAEEAGYMYRHTVRGADGRFQVCHVYVSADKAKIAEVKARLAGEAAAEASARETINPEPETVAGEPGPGFQALDTRPWCDDTTKERNKGKKQRKETNTPTSSLRSEDAPSGGRSSPAVPISRDWVPSPELRERIKRQYRMDDVELRQHILDFIRWHLDNSKLRKDYGRAFMNWVLRARAWSFMSRANSRPATVSAGDFEYSI